MGHVAANMKGRILIRMFTVILIILEDMWYVLFDQCVESGQLITSLYARGDPRLLEVEWRTGDLSQHVLVSLYFFYPLVWVVFDVTVAPHLFSSIWEADSLPS